MEPVTRRRWQQRTPEGGALSVAELAAALDLSPLTARLLLNRGVADVAAAEAVMTPTLAALPDPCGLTDMAAAVARLVSALTQGETIAVHGDYDADGICAAALMTEGLQRLGAAAVLPLIPHRMRDGYGLSVAALEAAHQRGARLVVSVDCGVSALAEAERARVLGLDLIVTDHHQVPSQLPTALAVVNPQRRDNALQVPELAGVGVAFFVLVALRRALRERGWFATRAEPDLREGLDLVALGTVADVAALTGINRVLVSAGLARCNGRDRRCGLQALCAGAGVEQVSVSALGFRLAPRLNAAGRLDDASCCVELLLTDDLARARGIAATLEELNRERQALEDATLVEALEAARQSPMEASLVLAGDGWHPGVIGIVASRLVERFGRPAVLVAFDEDEGKGSARSVPGVDLYAMLSAAAVHLQTFGGHPAAAGLSLERDQLEPFRQRFEQVVDDHWPVAERTPCSSYDLELSLAQMSSFPWEEVERLQPCGMGWPAPCICVRQVRPTGLRLLRGGHVRFELTDGRHRHPVILFGAGGQVREQPLDLLLLPEVSVYRSQRQRQWRVRDWRPAEPT